MARLAGSLLTGAGVLFLLSAVSGRAGAADSTSPAGKQGAAAGTTVPTTTPPALDAKSVPATKNSALDAKSVPATKNSAPDAKSVPAAKNGAPDAKTPAKNDSPVKGDATSPSEKAARPEAADGAEKPVKATGKAPARKKAVVAKDAGPRVGEGPSPATPPPLTIGGLRDEVRREGASVTIDPSAPARTKVEQMLAEITKARESLREDTTRLEAMMGDSAESQTTGAASGAAPGSGTAKPPAKSPLDVLAKALRGIKPEQAAPIVARLDKRLAATVLLRMPPVDAGKIMGALKPDTAAELATQISMRVTPGEAKR